MKLGGEPKLRCVVEAEDGKEGPLVLEMHPGETIRAKLKLERVKHNGVVSFGKEDSGRNLPHGVYVDNIGLNGLLLLSNQSEREFFVTASPIAEPGTSTFFILAGVGFGVRQSAIAASSSSCFFGAIGPPRRGVSIPARRRSLVHRRW